MDKRLILTLTGEDRVGLVEQITGVLLAQDANIETSRMVRVGGEFVVLVLMSVPEDRVESVAPAFAELIGQGYGVSVAVAAAHREESRAGWAEYFVEVAGADHEGIVHDVARRLAAKGVSIDEMDTEVIAAPITGAPLFTMSATVAVPPGLSDAEWQGALADAADEMGVDVTVTRDLQR